MYVKENRRSMAEKDPPVGVLTIFKQGLIKQRGNLCRFSRCPPRPLDQVHPYRRQDGQQSEQELLQGQAEEYAFLIVSDFFVDANFHELQTSNMG